MSVSSIEHLDKLDAILYGRPAGRNIIGYAIEEIKRLRAELAECRELLRRAYGYTTIATDLLPEEIKSALAAKEKVK